MAANQKNSAPLTPKRIQRKRTAGFRMPKGAIYVGRGSKWGNPFKLINNQIYYQAMGEWFHYDYGKYADIKDVVKLFRDLLISPSSPIADPEIIARFVWMNNHIRELKGKDLSCWCSLSAPCHCDPLLELANA